MQRRGKMTEGKLAVLQEQLSLNLCGQEGLSMKEKLSESSFYRFVFLVSVVFIRYMS